MKKPKYEALADSLLRKINRGVYPGSKLPSMSAIAKEYAVNLQTANRAVKFLEQQGIVSCFSGKKGTVINTARATLSEVGKSGSSSFMVDQVFSSPVRNKLRFLHNYFNDSMQNCFKECAQRFTQRYPWTEIEIIQIDTLKRIENDEIPYDTVLLNGRDVSPFARKGHFFKLKDYPELAEICEEEFFPGIWKNCRVKNDLYAVPFSWSVPLAAERGKESAFSWQTPEIAQRHPGSFNIGFYSLICLFLGEPFQLDLLPEKKQVFHELLALIRKLCVSPDGELLFWDNPAALRSFNVKKNNFIYGYYSNINTIIGREKDWHYSVLPPLSAGRKYHGERVSCRQCPHETAPGVSSVAEISSKQRGSGDFHAAVLFSAHPQGNGGATARRVGQMSGTGFFKCGSSEIILGGTLPALQCGVPPACPVFLR